MDSTIGAGATGTGRRARNATPMLQHSNAVKTTLCRITRIFDFLD
jgi:hypothetical protein